MRLVTWIVLAFSVLATALGFAAKLTSFGGQGVFTLAMAVLPAALVGVSRVLGRPFGRAFAGISLVAFLIVGMKTSEPAELQNIMMAAAVGVLLSVVLLIKPERPRGA